MAFDPGKYESRHGPLYRSVEIRRGCKCRRLHVPAPLLHAVQRFLLRRLLAPALRDLPDFVACRPGGSVFDAAAPHVGQRFVVNLDLRHFFPSTRLGQIIRVLRAERPGRVKLGPLACTNDAGQDQAPWFWSHPAAVLVARLVTRRGRLPQGAPTSPAVADLAFHPYDLRLRRELGPDFIYTRYVDDITVSLGERAASRLGLRTPGQVRERVLATVEQTLRSSGFVLNHRKTRTSVLGPDKSGRVHRVTGLVAGRTTLSLPRPVWRRLRSLGHHLDPKQNFLNAALTYFGRELDNQVERRPGDQRHFRPGRRLSEERLAVRFLKKLYPDLVVESLSEGDDREVYDFSSRPGRILEKVLNRLWLGTADARRDKQALQVTETDGSPLCRLRRAKKREPPQFFLLPRWQAFACLNYWLYAVGQASRLKVPPRHRDVGQPVHKWHERLNQALAGIHVEATGGAAPPDRLSEEGKAADRRPILPLAEVKSALQRVTGLLREFARETSPDAHLPEGWGNPRFDRAARTGEELDRWLSEARSLVVGRLQYWPPAIRRDPFEALRVFPDRRAGKRTMLYLAELEYFVQGSAGRLRDRDVPQVQLKILTALEKSLIEEKPARNRADSRDEWLRSLRTNLFAGEGGSELAGLLEKEVERFREAHRMLIRAKWIRKGGPPDQCLGLLREVPAAQASIDEVWQHLFRTGLELTKATTENLALPPGTPVTSEAGAEQIKDFKERLQHLCPRARAACDTWYALRNREAHAAQPYKAHEWSDTQKKVARVLGKVPPGRPPKVAGPDQAVDLFAGDHLRLSALEAAEVKFLLLRDFTDGLLAIPSDATSGAW